MTTDRSRLYGRPFAEDMYFDMGEVLEQLDEDGGVIEEWSTKPPIEHLPPVDTIIEWITEWSAENGELTENAYDFFANPGFHVEVIAAFERARQVFASKVTGRMADTLLATHVVTFAGDGLAALTGQRDSVTVANPHRSTGVPVTPDEYDRRKAGYTGQLPERLKALMRFIEIDLKGIAWGVDGDAHTLIEQAAERIDALAGALVCTEDNFTRALDYAHRCSCTWEAFEAEVDESPLGFLSIRDEACAVHGDETEFWARTTKRARELAAEHGLLE